jgi:hypothetical protein
VKSGIWHILCISKPRADRGKLVPFLELSGQIYPETGLTYEAPKCVLASVIHFADNSGLKFFSISTINGVSDRNAQFFTVKNNYTTINKFPLKQRIILVASLQVQTAIYTKLPGESVYIGIGPNHMFI